jgi:hypothetical protein
MVVRGYVVWGMAALAFLYGCGDGTSGGSPQPGNFANPPAPVAASPLPPMSAPPAPPAPPSLTAADRANLAEGVRTHFYNLRWSDFRFGGRCGDNFAVTEVEITDASLRGNTGEIVVVAQVIETNPPRYTDFPWRYCFGVGRSGSSQRFRLEMNIEKWDSGWRLAREQPRLSPI